MNTMRRILIAEGNRTLRLIMCNVFSSRYAVKTVGDLKSLNAALAGEEYDLVITDLTLPDQHGTTALHYEELSRTQLENFHTPTIILTSKNADDGELVALQRLGNVVEVWAKPANLQHLKLRVDEVLGHAYAREPDFAEMSLPQALVTIPYHGLRSIVTMALEEFSLESGFA